MAKTKTLDDISKQLKEDNKVQKQTAKNTEKLAKNMDAFLKILGAEKLKRREDEIEKPKRQSSKSGGLLGKVSDAPIITAILGFVKKFGLIIAGLIGTVLAFADETFNDIARTVAAVSLGVTKAIKRLFSPLTGIVVKGYTRLVNFLKSGLYRFLMLGADGKPIASVVKGVQGAKGAGVMTKFFRFLTKIFGTIGKFVGGTTFNMIGKSLGMLGTVFKVLFKPIGLILTLISTIQGAIKGYEHGGWVNMITEGIAGLLSSLVGAPLNLIKEIGLWVGEKMGFLSKEDRDKLSKEFDFEKIIMDAGRAIGDWLRDLPKHFEALLDFITPDWIVKLAEYVGIKEKAKTSKETVANTAAMEDIDYSDKHGLFDESRLSNGGAILAELKLLNRKVSPELSEMSMDETADAGGYVAVPVDGQRALGGSVLGGKTYLVGEKGPELLKMKQGMMGNVVPNNQIGSTLGKIMDASAPMAQFGHAQGKKMKAKEDAMRAAGASDMEIAQSMMGDMGGIMGGLKGAIGAGGLDKLKMPKMDMSGVKEMFKPQNIGNAFGAMVNESEASKREQAAKQPAPIIVNSDNSVRSGGTSNTAMPVQSQPFDFNDPFIRGMRMV